MRVDRTALPDTKVAEPCESCGSNAHSRPTEGKDGWTIGCYRAKYPDPEEPKAKKNPCKGNEVSDENRRLCIRRWNRQQLERAKRMAAAQ